MTGDDLPYFAGPPPQHSRDIGVIALHVLHGILPDLQPQHAPQWQIISHNTFREWGRGRHMAEYRARVGLALRFMEEGYAQEPEAVSRVFIRTLADHRHSHKIAFFSADEARQKESHERGEVAIRPQLEHYNDLYENFWRLVVAPVTFSKDVTSREPDAALTPEKYVGLDANRKYRKLNSLIVLGGSPIDILVHGCHRHLRNAIAHRRYRFLETGVQAWDEAPDGRRTWEQTLTIGDVRRVIGDVGSTIAAIETALMIFHMRHRAEMSARSWDDALRNELATLEEEQSALFMMAREMFFELLGANVDEANDVLRVRLRLPLRLDPRGQGQIVIGGGTGPPRVLNLNWVVIRTPLRTHVLGYLQRVAGYLGDHPQLMVSVEAHDGRGLGHVKLTREQLNVVRRGNEPPDQIRLLEDDLDPAFEVEVSIPEDVGPAS